MSRIAIYFTYYMAVSALMSLSFVDQAYAACDPPRDVSSCVRVPKEIFAQENPVLPEPPFLVTYPDTPNALVLTHFNYPSLARTPKNNNCAPQDVSGCAWVPSAHLTNSVAANKPARFLVLLPDGRPLLVSSIPKH